MQITIPHSPVGIARTLVRISFGFSLMFIAIGHYTDIQSFALVVADGLEPISLLATFWAYLHPAFLLFGGALFVVNRFPVLATLSAGLPLALIPAGMLFKVIFGLDLNDMMSTALTAWIWILVYLAVVTLTWSEQAKA